MFTKETIQENVNTWLREKAIVERMASKVQVANVDVWLSERRRAKKGKNKRKYREKQEKNKGNTKENIGKKQQQKRNLCMPMKVWQTIEKKREKQRQYERKYYKNEITQKIGTCKRK